MLVPAGIYVRFKGKNCKELGAAFADEFHGDYIPAATSVQDGFVSFYMIKQTPIRRGARPSLPFEKPNLGDFFGNRDRTTGAGKNGSFNR